MTTEYTPNFALAIPDFREGPWHELVNNNIKKIDALLANALSTTNVARWENNTPYVVGVSVFDEADGSVWVCLEAHTSPTTGTFAEARSASADQWSRLLTGFAPRGEWENNTNYFPYDLAYHTEQGVFALCEVAHTSNASGSIKDDEAYWAFIFDFSDSNLTTAVAVTYSNAVSPTLPNTNVQAAIDKLEDFVVSLNSVNVTQGEDIVQLREDMETAIATLSDATMKLAGNQIVTGGFRITPFNAGNSTGLFIPDTLKGNYQYINNVTAFTIQAPANDCAMDILITNSGTAGNIAFSGFTVGPNIGDLLTITNGHKFIVSIRKINGTATYSVKALQ